MKNIAKILSVVPWIYIVSFYSYVIRVAIKVGHLPGYNNPDPSYIYLGHRNIISYSFEFSFWGSIIGVLLLIIFRRKLFDTKNRRYLYSFVLGISIIIFNLFFDPFDTWYLD